MHLKDNRLVFIGIQVAAWMLVILSIPLFVYLQENSVAKAVSSIPSAFMAFLPALLCFFINSLLLVPKSLFAKKKFWFFAGNFLILSINLARLIIPVVQNGLPEHFPEDLPFSLSMILTMGAFFQIFLQLLIVFLAIASCYIERYYRLKREEARQKQKAAEAELIWLKSQLNPHFLFNTLNNISSLIQIDADKAQESIGQFSDLLRYALYDTEANFVSLSREVEFMENYVDLMSLRCNELTTVCKEFDIMPTDVRIAPLLFISLIENAFKHGVNARQASFVSIKMHLEGNDLVFVCENSVFEKAGVDRIGSGIGLSNLKKRLDLIYPDHYKYNTSNKDGVYTAVIILKGIC